MPAPDPDLTRPGDILLGKYRVENVLGRGGMGIVVAARHLSLDDRVAIKFLLPDRLGDEEALQRFLREARAAVRIRSQHIARVTDVGTMESGAPYMIMECLEGRNLYEVLAQDGPLPVPLAIELVLQASEALAEAHAQKIVHRDLKPSNLFLSRHADGSPCIKVLDFGISKMPGGHDHAITRTGAVFGSPLYMSPEQLRSARDVDPRTDIYSLGVVLYELVTGRVPFTAEDLPQLVYRIMNEAPIAPRALRAGVPETLERAIFTAMARDRESRFQTIAELAVAIAPLASRRAQGSVERIRGIQAAQGERQGAARHGDASGARQSGVLRPAGSQAPTALLVEPATTKAELQSSIGSFGATQGRPLRSIKGRRGAPIALGLGLVTICVVGLAVRSSRHVEPARVVSEGALIPREPAPEPPAIDAGPAPMVPSAIAPEPAPSTTPSASAEPSRVASPPHGAPSHTPRPPDAPASSQPATPRTRHGDKDPFKRDVF